MIKKCFAMYALVSCCSVYAQQYLASAFIAAHYPHLTENTAITLDVPIVIGSGTTTTPFVFDQDCTLTVQPDPSVLSNAVIEVAAGGTFDVSSLSNSSRRIEVVGTTILRCKPSSTIIVGDGGAGRGKLIFRDQSTFETSVAS